MAKPKSAPVVPSYTYNTLRWVILLVESLGAGAIAFTYVFFLFDDRSWHPRDLYIGETLIMIPTLGYYTYIFAKLYKCTPEQLAIELGTVDLGVYHRFCSFYILRALTTLAAFAMETMWLDIHEGPISSTETRNYLSGDKQTGETPKCPSKTEDGFHSFNSLAYLRVVFFFYTYTAALIVISDLYASESPLLSASEKESKSDIESKIRNYDPDVRTHSVSRSAKAAGSSYIYYGYTFGNILLYVTSFVYFAIFYVHSYENNAKLSLSGMFVLFMFIVVGFVTKYACYYIADSPMKSYYTNISENKIGSTVHAKLKNEQMFWVFLILFEFMYYIYYFAQSDHVAIFDSIPRLDRSVIQQTNQWYMFQRQTVLRGSQLVEWFIQVALIVYTSRHVPLSDRESEKHKIAGGTVETQINADTVGYKIYAWTFFSWGAVIAMLALNIWGISGYANFAVVYHRYAISFFVLGAAMTGLSMMMARVSSGMGVFIRKSSIFHSWTIYSVQVMGAVLIYFLLTLMNLAISWSKYSDLGHETMHILLKAPTVTPVNAVSYYWWNTIMMSTFLLLPIIRLMSESNATLVLKRFMKAKRNLQVTK